MTWWQVALVVVFAPPVIVLTYGMAWLMLSLARDEWRNGR